MTVEVRCCCEPGKLLGWVQLEDDRVVLGNTIRFAWFEPPAVSPLSLEPSTSTERVIEAHVRMFEASVQRENPDPWRLEVAERRSYLALDSGHQPLEVWRKVRGFTAR